MRRKNMRDCKKMHHPVHLPTDCWLSRWALAGIALLFMGFWCTPAGEIHNSVLVGFGEISTFSGALFGVDYTYKYRYRKQDEKE